MSRLHLKLSADKFNLKIKILLSRRNVPLYVEQIGVELKEIQAKLRIKIQIAAILVFGGIIWYN